MIGALGVALVVPLLVASVSDRGAGRSITGSDAGGAAGSSDLSFFEQRVIDHPRDLAGRLDLADRYLEAGDVRDAVTQYLSALSIDPRNPEAHANLGYVLYLSGRAEEGLKAVNEALAVEPQDWEALYFKGVILLRGLHRPNDAATLFRLYLQDAPFGARRAEVQGLLREARSPASP